MIIDTLWLRFRLGLDKISTKTAYSLIDKKKAKG